LRFREVQRAHIPAISCGALAETFNMQLARTLYDRQQTLAKIFRHREVKCAVWKENSNAKTQSEEKTRPKRRRLRKMICGAGWRF